MSKKTRPNEDEYFYKRSRELIEKRLLDEKKTEREVSKKKFKNHCASCGEQMQAHPTPSFDHGIFSCEACGSIHISAEILQSITGPQHEELRKVYFDIEEQKKKRAKVA